MNFQQSKTYQNIVNAYNIDAEANTRYQIYADQARLEGYIEIAAVYETTARNDKEHARIWMRKLNEGVLPNTEQNLQNSYELESVLGNNLFREYSRIAQEEGYHDIATLFNDIANIELYHELRFRSLHGDLTLGDLYCRPTEMLWICMQCGNIIGGLCAPEICPVCSFPQGYYRLYNNDVI